MYNMTLYFDSNGEMGDHAIGYIAYKGKTQFKPLFTGKIMAAQDDHKYAGYNQYMFKLEAVLQAIIGAKDYIKKEGLVNYHGGVNVEISSQHKPIHNMIVSNSGKDTYREKLSEIWDQIYEMEKLGIGVGIVNVEGDRNLAKKIVKEMLTELRSKPKQLTLTTTPDKLAKSLNRTGTNVIEIEKFKVM